MDIINQICSIKRALPVYLENQRNKGNLVDCYRFSYSCDIYDDTFSWNLPANIFAADIAYAIGMDKEKTIINSIEGIKSYIHKEGYIYSDFIWKRGALSHLKAQIKSGKLTDVYNKDYIRAESRQALRTLMNYEQKVKSIPKGEVLGIDESDKFLQGLNWRYPWSAGSHYSHLLFYEKVAYQYGMISRNEYEKRVRFLTGWIEQKYDKKSGIWGENVSTEQEALNGVMKVLTGLMTIQGYTMPKEQARLLIDLCLKNADSRQACDNYNVLYVLYCCVNAENDYRRSEINQFAEQKFSDFLQYYYPTYGGFSFIRGSSNKNYYGFKITKGFNQPDIHGTRMFVWGIGLIAVILQIDNEIGWHQIKE